MRRNMRLYLSLLFFFLFLFPTYAGVFDSPTDMANEEHAFTTPETATNCPKLLGVPKTCSPVCPEGWKLIGTFDPKTGAYSCQDPDDPNHICQYVNPACRLDIYDTGKGIASQIYSETEKKVFWNALGVKDFQTLSNGLSFPEWWVHLLTLDPDVYQKIHAYWNELNNSDSSFALVVKYTSKFISEAARVLADIAIILAGVLGLGGALKIGWDTHIATTKNPGLDFSHEYFTNIKGKALGFFLSAAFFTFPVYHKVPNPETGGYETYYYPLVVDVVRTFWTWGNEWANKLAHKENELFVEYIIDREFKSFEALINLHKKLQSYTESQIDILDRNLLQKCEEAYGKVNWDEVDISTLTPLPNYSGEAPTPAQCYTGYQTLKRLVREYNYHKKKVEEYTKLLKDILDETKFKEDVIAEIVKFEKMTGWLSASLIPIYASYAPSVLEDRLQDSEQYQEVREKYIKLGYIYGWSKVNAPWKPEDNSEVQTFSDDKNFITKMFIYLGRIAVFTQLPPGSFIDQALTKIIIGSGEKKKDAKTMLDRIKDIVVKVLTKVPFVPTSWLSFSGMITSISLVIVIKFIAYVIAVALLGFLPFIAIIIATLFRFVVYSVRVLTSIVAALFLIVKVATGQGWNAVAQFLGNVIEYTFYPLYIVTGIGIAMLVSSMMDILMFKLPDLFLNGVAHIAYLKNEGDFIVVRLIENTFWFFVFTVFSSLFFYFAKIAATLASFYVVYNSPELIKEWIGDLFGPQARSQVVSYLKEHFVGRFLRF
jgi:hypothetical protein